MIKKREIFISNLIFVLNLIWEISDNNSKNFNRYISNLGIYINYAKRDEKNNDIYFVLLTTLSINLYNFILYHLMVKLGFKIGNIMI